MSTSSRGGARELLRLAMEGQATLITSEYALAETERSLREKSPQSADVFALIRTLSIWTIINHTRAGAKAAQNAVKDPDDAPIIAAAREAEADALISFDRKHLFTQDVEKFLGAPVMTAGDAIHLLQSRGR